MQAKRYKAVNMAGAAVIVAVTNALGIANFRSCSAATARASRCRPQRAAIARDALAATAAWVKEELDLTLRTGLVPVAAARAQGADVRVARFAASDNIAFAMFSGGGLAWADAAMKAGQFALPPAPPGTRPDLSGLSCRFEEIPAVRGLILSLLVMPAPDAKPADVRASDRGVVRFTERRSRRVGAGAARSCRG